MKQPLEIGKVITAQVRKRRGVKVLHLVAEATGAIEEFVRDLKKHGLTLWLDPEPTALCGVRGRPPEADGVLACELPSGHEGDYHQSGRHRWIGYFVDEKPKPRPPAVRQTHTYAVLEIPRSAWADIRARLSEAGYDHAFMEREEIDMHGIAVAPLRDADPSAAGLAGLRLLDALKHWPIDPATKLPRALTPDEIGRLEVEFIHGEGDAQPVGILTPSKERKPENFKCVSCPYPDGCVPPMPCLYAEKRFPWQKDGAMLPDVLGLDDPKPCEADEGLLRRSFERCRSCPDPKRCVDAEGGRCMYSQIAKFETFTQPRSQCRAWKPEECDFPKGCSACCSPAMEVRCTRCLTPTRDPKQEHPGVCVCGGYLMDIETKPSTPVAACDSAASRSALPERAASKAQDEGQG